MDNVYIIISSLLVMTAAGLPELIIDCSFVGDFCGFETVSANNDFEFVLDQDGFAYTNTSDPSLSGSAVSSMIQEGMTPSSSGDACLEFRYKMRGVDPMGYMEVVVMPNSDPNLAKTVWLLKNSYEKKPIDPWHRAEVTISLSSQTPSDIVFRVNMTSFTDAIAFDDIKLTPGVCKQDTLLNEPFFCDMEDETLCGLAQEPIQDDFDFTWLSGRSSKQDTGPVADHTTGQGHYLVLESSSFADSPNGTALLKTPALTASRLTSCLSFAYHMYGNDVNKLNVLVSTASPLFPLKSAVSIWTVEGSQDGNWITQKLDLATLGGSYKVFFEASKSFGLDGDIAIDDINIRQSNCEVRRYLTCTFNDGWCGFLNVLTGKWKIGTKSSVQLGPQLDRMGQSDPFMFLPAENLPTGEKALLASPVLNTGSRSSCLSFWYHLNMVPTDAAWKLSVLTVNEDGLSSEKAVYNVSMTEGAQWRRAAVTIETPKPFRVMFLGVVGSQQTKVTVAIDDVEVYGEPCPFDRSMSTISCDFDDPNICGWGQSLTDNFQWYWHQGPTPDVKYTGPSNDHGGQGHYMYMESSNPRYPGDTTVLISPSTKVHRPESCLTFWYHMKGNTVGTLRVAALYSDQNETTLWERTGPQGGGWLEASINVDLTPDIPFQVIFEGIVGDVDEGDIAIDDVQLVNLPCPGKVKTSVSCNFDDIDICGYKRIQTNSTEWIHSKDYLNEDMKNISDHTTGKGSFMYDRERPQKSLLVSPSFVWNREIGSLTFKLLITDPSLGTLNVYAAPTGMLYDRTLLYSSGLNYVSPVKIDIYSKYPVQFIFEGIREPGFDGLIAINDIVLLAEKSDSPVDCDFSDGHCVFTKISGNMPFNVKSGKTPSSDTGPTADHTDGKGSYIYSEASDGVNDDQELLIESVVVDTTVTKNCLSFWYHMYGVDIISLTVFKASPDDPNVDSQVLWSRKGEQDQDWHNVQLNVDGSVPYKLYVRFVATYDFKGDSALDDIKLTVGRTCEEESMQGTAVDCSFDTDLCGYTHLPAVDDWQRVMNSSDGVLYLYSLQNLTHSSPVLESPVLSDHPRKICLRVWWLTEVPYNSTLAVEAVDVNTGSTVAQFSSDYQDNGWQLEEIDMDHTSPLKFRFQADPSREEDSQMIQLALDDVEVTTGTCHEVPWTEEWKFRCDRPTTPCVNGDCDPVTKECNCTAGMIGLDCSEAEAPCSASPCQRGICYIKDGLARCTCPDGYYGDTCQHQMVYAECTLETMTINIFPYGFDKGGYQGFESPEIVNTSCMMYPSSTFASMRGSTRQWAGFVREFLNVNDNCAGDAMVEMTPEFYTYTRQVKVYYDRLGRHKTDTIINVTCSTPNLPHVNITLETTELGTSIYSSKTFGRGGWPTYIELKFSLNIPNREGVDELKMDWCELTIDNVGSAVVVNNGCVVPNIGVMLSAGRQRGTEVLMIRLYKRPGSIVQLKLSCKFHLCITAKNDFSCYWRSMCLNSFNSLYSIGRKRRSAGRDAAMRTGELSAGMTLNEGQTSEVSYTFTA